MDAWEREHPGRLETIFRALGHVVPAQLADRDWFDFAALGARGNTPAPDAHAWLAGVPYALADAPV